MRKIDKQHQEPSCLTTYKRETTNHDYTRFTNEARDCFDDLRLQLAQETGFLCCYCMQRIGFFEDTLSLPKIQVEHFKPKSVHNGNEEKEDLRLEYNNLLACCLGNNDLKKGDEKHCGALKGNVELSLPNPATREFIDFQTRLNYKLRY